MAEDKWGIPFWYPTKKTAGNTGKGTGFFWQQNNNIFKDNDAGMVRLGKERSACKVIDSNTGEWEFPFNFDSGDGLSLSGPTGHHSGGETHGCEGFTYMINVTLDQNPAHFRFRKETFHVQYDNHPEGLWTHPKVNYKVVGHGWNGYGWVRYNKKGGRKDGGDSVVCEAWWNPDPVNNLKDGWIMLRRSEDKGKGATNWGVKATCNGVDYQVGTWSNIQFRFKVDASDFSLHPIKPEFEDGSNIHSIGDRNMDFAASEKRGYGYAANMPRDIEMKCLFKFSDTSGKCRFKHISLREIDPNLAPDDTPEVPEPGEEPGTTQTIQGKFKLQWDLNTNRDSACAGVGIGGAGGSAKFYIITIIDSQLNLCNHADHSNRTRVAEKCTDSSNRMKGKKLKQLDQQLMKVGAPGSSPSIHAKIWNSSGSVVYDSPTTVNPTSLSTSAWTTISFDFSGNTHSLAVGDYVGIEYTGTDPNNNVIVPVRDEDIISGSCRSKYESGTWHDSTTTDFTTEMWE